VRKKAEGKKKVKKEEKEEVSSVSRQTNNLYSPLVNT